MSGNNSIIAQNVEQLSSSANLDFEHLSDYIWKSVRLIGHERQIEIEKLQIYYPDDLEMQKLLWKLESRKLDSTFPFLIAQGNFLNVTAMFEIYVFLLAKIVESVSSSQLTDIRGQGVTRSLDFLKATGILYTKTKNWEQVSVALKFRNCIIHASGALDYSREDSQIKNIVGSKRFFTSDILKRHKDLGEEITDVTIYPHPMLGERLVIKNSYSHWIAFILRHFFLDLCSEVLTQL